MSEWLGTFPVPVRDIPQPDNLYSFHIAAARHHRRAIAALSNQQAGLRQQCLERGIDPDAVIRAAAEDRKAQAATKLTK